VVVIYSNILFYSSIDFINTKCADKFLINIKCQFVKLLNKSWEVAMKKLLVFFAVISLVFAQVSYVTNKGDFGVRLSLYGNVNIYKGSSVKANRHIYQTSLLISTGEVFTFNNVNDSYILDIILDSAKVVENPQKSIYELTCRNGESKTDPLFETQTTVYGWDSRYAVIKYTIKNNDTKNLTGKIGLEIQPNIDAGYGNENISYDANTKVLMMSRALPTSKTKVGVKFNKEVYSLNSFDWFPEYDTMALAQRDSMYWDYATNNQINTYNNMPSSDGQVVLVYFDNIDIPTNESYEVIYAYAIASTEDSVKTMLDEAATKFNELTRVEKIDTKVTNFELYQNYPNPFNPATNIKFAIVQNDFVTLTVYNSLGQEIAQLVNENLSAGTYNVKFDANNLPSGIYYYQLKTSNNQLTKKMMLIK